MIKDSNLRDSLGDDDEVSQCAIDSLKETNSLRQREEIETEERIISQIHADT